MLEININSYVTVDEADEYIANHYSSLNSSKNYWQALLDEDKEIYLVNSTKELECLKTIGTKYIHTQDLDFPRVKPGECPQRRLYQIPYPCLYRNVSQVPKEVKYAQIENALGLLLAELSTTPKPKYKGLSSEKAYMLMRGWFGSFNVI